MDLDEAEKALEKTGREYAAALEVLRDEREFANSLRAALDDAVRLLTEIGCGKHSLPGTLRQIESFLDKRLFLAASPSTQQKTDEPH